MTDKKRDSKRSIIYYVIGFDSSEEETNMEIVFPQQEEIIFSLSPTTPAPPSYSALNNSKCFNGA